MPTFEYKAKTKEGETRTGAIEASSQENAVDLLQQNSLIIISVNETGGVSFLKFKFGFGHKIKSKDIVILSRQLSTLFEAHIPVVVTLKTLMGENTKPALRAIIAEILDDVNGGMALSQAMAKHPEAFSPFYTNLAKSGEESGKLQASFTYLADYLERSYYLNSKARNAMIYPAFVLSAFVGVLIVMMVVVIPKLVTIFEETGQPIPLYTQIVIKISLLLRNWGLFVAAALIALVASLWRWSKTIQGRLFFHKLQINIPVIGGIYRKLFMARLTDNLRTMFMGGIPIIRALTITSDVVGNEVYKKAVEEAIESVKGGSTISAAFEKTPEIPTMVTQMIRVGETSGRLDAILGNIAKFYQKDVDAALENMVVLIEPVLIIFLGAGAGILISAILIPLYNLVGSI